MNPKLMGVFKTLPHGCLGQVTAEHEHGYHRDHHSRILIPINYRTAMAAQYITATEPTHFIDLATPHAAAA